MTKKDKIIELFDASGGQMPRKEIAEMASATKAHVDSVLALNGLRATERLAEFYKDSKNHMIIKVDKEYRILRLKY